MGVLERSDSLQNLHRRTIQLPEWLMINESTIPLQIARYLPVLPALEGADIFHSSYYRGPLQCGPKRVITVYDFTYEFFSSGLKRFVHGQQKRMAIRQAHGIICISENTMQDLLRLFPSVSEERVRVIHLGVSASYHPISADVTVPDYLCWINDITYVIFVGDRRGYKNFNVAVQAVSMVKNYHLVIVGGSLFSREEYKLLEQHLSTRYRHVRDMSEESLNFIYNHALCLLYPSSYEGFGLPPLEAMRAGCPVVAMNSSSLYEVCGEAGLLANAPEPDLFVSMMLSLEQTSFRQEMVSKGYKQALKFTWEATCKKTMDFYQVLASDSRRDTQV
jgi:mannosyltransferase